MYRIPKELDLSLVVYLGSTLDGLLPEGVAEG